MVDNYDLDNFEPAAKIIVIGVGGAGNNAVNRMIDEEIANVTFYVANTDKQALSTSKAPNRIILGQSVTDGLGAGGDPEVGRLAAEASEDEIREIVKDAHMVFIAAGMGGGTGTGAAPVIAHLAKEAGALVVAIVTRPFTFEGRKRIVHSIDGLNNLKKNVDAIIVISNDKLLMMQGNAPIGNAFNASDNVLAQSVKTVVNLILLPAVINLDFADVRTTLRDSGVALIGFGLGKGPNKAREAASAAINSPLLEASITGARKAIVAITCGPQVSLLEAQETVNRLIDAAGHDIDIKFGISINDQLTDEILVSVIASDFENDIDLSEVPVYNPPIREKEGSEETSTSTSEGTTSAEETTEEKDEDLLQDDILPNFLKD
ncbi:MAG: cell division protein FtsZ [Bacilli bacterium]|nr:cell division protein FtsZ [Bacilli bacterium]